MKTLSIALLMLGASSLPAAAADWFDHVDADGDGEITRQEAMAGQEEAFQSIDLDGDGNINMYEWKAYMTREFDAVDSDESDSVTRDEMDRFRQGWEAGQS